MPVIFNWEDDSIKQGGLIPDFKFIQQALYATALIMSNKLKGQRYSLMTLLSLNIQLDTKLLLHNIMCPRHSLMNSPSLNIQLDKKISFYIKSCENIGDIMNCLPGIGTTTF